MAINRKSVTRTRGGEKGMSLVELLIAVSVMCIAVLAIYSALVSAQCMSRSAKEDNISSFELQSIVEDVRSTPFEEILEEYPNGKFVNAYEDKSLNSERIRVDYVDEEEEPLDITFTLTWVNYQGRQCTKSLRTLVAR